MRLAFLLSLLLWAWPAAAQPVVTSAAPESVSVTVYRDPDRGQGGINARFPSGFALITEQRRIALPSGDAVIRFEGVADGMIAVSAVVTGLPGGVVQKNRDAKLLSPAALLDGTLGNRVHLRRTDRVTGKVVEQEAIIRSGPDNAVVLQTAEGFEGLRCSGLPETLVYDKVPDGLSAKPTLSVTTSSPAAITATVTLTYLATGFDWGANYVAKVADDRRTLDLFAWLTVANGNSVSFADSQMLAVAGRLNRESDYDQLVATSPEPSLALDCWPLPDYDDLSLNDYANSPSPPPPPPPPVFMSAPMASEIVVTASRVARQEELGDLKLYRVPMRVDVNAKAQKQVALLQKQSVPFDIYYAADIWNYGRDGEESQPLNRMVRMQNRDGSGLGLPLPAGGIALFEQSGGESLLVADSQLRDYAIGEKVNVSAGQSAQHRYVHIVQMNTERSIATHELALTNAANKPARVEIKLRVDDSAIVSSPGNRLVQVDGIWLWATTIPANGTARLLYRVVSPASR